MEAAVKKDAGLLNGINIYDHKCTNENVAKSLGYDYVDINELI